MSYKLLCVLHLPPPLHGVSLINNYLKKDKKFNSFFNSTYINLSTSKIIEDIGAKFLVKITNVIKLYSRVTSKLSKGDVDILYITLSSSGLALYKDGIVVILAMLYRVKIVIHLHNKEKFNKWAVLRNLFRYIVFSKNTIVILSNKLSYNVPQSCKVRICSNGIRDIPEYQAQKRKNVRIRFLFLSNLFKSKGVMSLLHIADSLKSRGLDFELMIAGPSGDITESKLIEMIEEKDLSNYVVVHGGVFDEEKIALLQNSDVFVYPTMEDCMPLVLIEAMRSGMPVVAYNEGAISELIDNGLTGFLVQRGDVESMVYALEEYVLNPDLVAQHGNRARISYENAYTYNVFVDRLVKIILGSNAI